MIPRWLCLEVVHLVLSNSPDLNIKGGGGYTALELALFKNNYQLAEKLIQHGAKLDTTGHLAVHLAAQFSNYSMLDYLIKKNFNVNIQDEHGGNTPLILSLTCCGDGFGDGITQEDRVKTIELLLDNGADPNIKNSGGESFIESAKNNRHPQITSTMIDREILIKGNEKNKNEDAYNNTYE